MKARTNSGPVAITVEYEPNESMTEDEKGDLWLEFSHRMRGLLCSLPDDYAPVACLYGDKQAHARTLDEQEN